MLLNLKVFLSLLLALGLVACPGEDEKDDAKYSLKVAKPSTPAVGTEFTLKVELHKGDAIVKDDDAKAAKDAVLKGSIKCEEHSEKVDATDVKFGAAGSASLAFTIADNSNKDDGDDKGYTKCVVSASTEFGTDKTKASGSSEQFAVAAKTDGEEKSEEDGDLTLPTSIKAGEQFEITNGATENIKLVNDSGACNDHLFRIPTTGVPSKVAATGVAIAAGDHFVVIGNTCKVKVGSLDAVTVAAAADFPVAVTDIVEDADTNKIGISLPARPATVQVAKVKAYAKKTSDAAWTPVPATNITGWTDSATFTIASTVVADTTTVENNHVLLNIGDAWHYGTGS